MCWYFMFYIWLVSRMPLRVIIQQTTVMSGQSTKKWVLKVLKLLQITKFTRLDQFWICFILLLPSFWRVEVLIFHMELLTI
uniref:Uncharacterized protein n=1 Tax=Rhizophora mucronata TaxID=61149 RepID=A0A2P2QS56_RHIMU